MAKHPLRMMALCLILALSTVLLSGCGAKASAPMRGAEAGEAEGTTSSQLTDDEVLINTPEKTDRKGYEDYAADKKFRGYTTEAEGRFVRIEGVTYHPELEKEYIEAWLASPEFKKESKNHQVFNSFAVDGPYKSTKRTLWNGGYEACLVATRVWSNEGKVMYYLVGSMKRENGKYTNDTVSTQAY